jgi:hypothetical protein
MNTITIENDLTITIGRQRVQLSPRQGLDIAEQLARKSFRLALTQEAASLGPGFDPAGIEEPR